jgi:cellulose synthase/poly-beta-1,6-N-acetylglucosamine synthase-like glycosyltransferase
VTPTSVAVIVSTYNQPVWLEKSLIGFSCQDHRDFDIVIADDGSSEETRNVINRLRDATGLRITHVWHEDAGFRKTMILNKAVSRTECDYLVFTDGDCIPRRDFVRTHLSLAMRGWFLSGGYFKLPDALSKSITRDDIISGRATDPRWLRENGAGGGLRIGKLSASPVTARILNAVTPTKATWNGHNSSGWKTDIVAVNGFDERMEYGGEDRELGERLVNAGIRGKQIRYSAVCVHLEHPRGYRREEAIQLNREIRRVTRETRAIWTEFGIVKGPRR